MVPRVVIITFLTASLLITAVQPFDIDLHIITTVSHWFYCMSPQPDFNEPTTTLSDMDNNGRTHLKLALGSVKTAVWFVPRHLATDPVDRRVHHVCLEEGTTTRCQLYSFNCATRYDMAGRHIATLASHQYVYHAT